MPPQKPSAATKRKVSVDKAAATTEVAAVRHLADALCRAATECARQHDRFSRLLVADATLPAEELLAQEICGLCDHGVAELAASFERAISPIHPSPPSDWLRRAQALWQASRDYAKRHSACDALTKRLPAKHTPQQLWQLEIEFELEASALLALRHACAAYARAAD